MSRAVDASVAHGLRRAAPLNVEVTTDLSQSAGAMQKVSGVRVLHAT